MKVKTGTYPPSGALLMAFFVWKFRLSLPKGSSKRKVGAFTSTEQTALLNQLKDHRLYALFVFALGAGMRIGEILALRWVDKIGRASCRERV